MVGGVNAEKDSWPWQAAIKVNGALFCGGTLIAKKWVLTAGHCLVKGGALVQEGDLEVILGEYDRYVQIYLKGKRGVCRLKCV